MSSSGRAHPYVALLVCEREERGRILYRSVMSVVRVGKSNTLSQYLHLTGLVYRPPPDMTKAVER